MGSTATQNVVVCLDDRELTQYTVAVDLDLIGKFLTIRSRDDESSIIARLFQTVCAGSMFEVRVTQYGRQLRSHLITNIDVLSLRFLSDTENRFNDWQLTLSFAECETTYPE